jgi:hypothetical protein
MAANTTEYNRAFQTSESGLTNALGLYMQNQNPGSSIATQIQNSEYQEIGPPVSYEEGGKISAARLEVRKSATEISESASTTRYFYIVRSTGFSQAQEDEDGNVIINEDESLTTRVRAGLSTTGATDTNLQTTISN